MPLTTGWLGCTLRIEATASNNGSAARRHADVGKEAMLMNRVSTYAEKVLQRANLLKLAAEKGMYYTDEAEQPVIEHQLVAAEKLARVVQLFVEAMESCVTESFDETLRSALSSTMQAATNICEGK